MPKSVVSAAQRRSVACKLEPIDAEILPIWYALPPSVRAWIRRLVVTMGRHRPQTLAGQLTMLAAKRATRGTSGLLLPFRRH